MKFRICIAFCIIALSLQVWTVEANSTDKFLEKAWTSLAENDQIAAEKYFLKSIKKDSTNARAHMGLSFLYEHKQNPEKSWDYFEKGIALVQNPNPYIIAELLSLKTRTIENDLNPKTIKLLEKFVENPDPEGVLQVEACGFLGPHYEEAGDREKAKNFYDKINPIVKWQLIGPFDNISASGHEKVFPPELEFNPDKSYTGKNGVVAKWFTIKQLRLDYWLDMTNYFAFESAIYYGNVFVYSPEKKSVQTRIGTSGSIKLFLNDELLLSDEKETNNAADTFRVKVDLQKGWNRLLIKCGSSDIVRCNFIARITDQAGQSYKDLTYSSDKQDYIPKPGVEFEIIESKTESFFTSLIEQHPDHYENYLFLADCLNKNDKVEQAEQVIQSAIEKLPNCTLFLRYMIEVYIRGDRIGEMQDVISHIFSLDPNVPRVLAYKFSEYLDTKD
ncbi:hypothetical protein K8T06_00975, partial [bacterium]|nr:hypothetical protein [bacterium]